MYIDKNGDGNVQLLSIGEEIKGSLHKKLVEIFGVLTSEDSAAEEINKALHELAETDSGKAVTSVAVFFDAFFCAFFCRIFC